MPARTPRQTLEQALAAGTAKAALSAKDAPSGKLILLSALAGAYIALGGVLSLIAGYGFPEIAAANPAIQKLISGAVFPIGLMLVVVLGAELFTGNNALLIPPLARRKISAGDVARNWLLVWLGNFAGALVFTYFMVHLTGLTAVPPYSEAIRTIAEAKVSAPWGVIFLKGIGANWCVCLAVWLALSGRRLGEKLLACEIPVMAFVVLGYEHCVANMFFIPAGMMEGAAVGISDLLLHNLLPSTLGNIFGGAILVGCVHTFLHAPSTNDTTDKEE